MLPPATPATRMLLKTFVLGLLVLLTARLGLVLWQLDRVSAANLLPQVFLYGLRADSIMMSLILLPPALLLPLTWWHRSWPLWRLLSAVWLAGCAVVLVFMETSTPAFLAQYEARPNRLFFEYLAWPEETLRMLWGGFRFQLLASSGLVVAVFVVAVLWLRRTLSVLQFRQPAWQTLAAWPLLVLTLALGVRSTLDHRPINPSWFAFSGDNLVNQLMLNSTWSLAHAVYNLRHESAAGERYGKMSEAEMLQTVKTTAADYGITDFVDHPTLPTLRHQRSAREDQRRLNLVIILEESLGATYVGALGGIEGLTPNLERLGEEGWWFENLYATGTRSVRGIEAVTTGFLPTPARAVVKLLGSRGGFFTLASLLGREGYRSEFIYGGEGHFDNMASFFLANGFDQVVGGTTKARCFWAAGESPTKTCLPRLTSGCSNTMLPVSHSLPWCSPHPTIRPSTTRRAVSSTTMSRRPRRTTPFATPTTLSGSFSPKHVAATTGRTRCLWSSPITTIRSWARTWYPWGGFTFRG